MHSIGGSNSACSLAANDSEMVVMTVSISRSVVALLRSGQSVSRFWLRRVVTAILLSAHLLAGAAENAPLLRIETGTHTASIRSLAVDADGQIMLTASDDKTARLWRLSDGQPIGVLRPPIGPGNEGKLYAAALTPQGDLAAVGGWSADNDVYIFRRESGAMRLRLSGMPNVINHLTFSPDGKMLAVALWGGHGIRVFTSRNAWSSAALLGEDSAYGGDSYSVSFSSDGRRLTSTAYDGYVRVYEITASGLSLIAKTRVSGGQHPFAARFSPDGKFLAVGFEDAGRVAVVKADDLTPAYSPDIRGLSDGNLTSVAWSPDGNTLYAAGTSRKRASEHVLRRWDDGGRGAFTDVTVAGDSVTGLAALPDQRVVFAAADASWGIVDAKGAVSYRQTVPLADFRANWSGFGIQQARHAIGFAYGFGGRHPALFDLDNQVLILQDAALPKQAVGGKGLEVSEWKDSQKPLINGQAVALEPGEMSVSTSVSAAGDAAALGSNWFVRLFDANGRELWRTATPAPCWAVDIDNSDPAKPWVVAALGDGTIRWYRRQDGVEQLALFPHADRQRWVMWTPDGRFSASQDGDGLVGWHVNRGPDQSAEFLPVARFSERYYNPPAIAAVLSPPKASPASPPPKMADLRKGINLPPSVTLLTPEAEKLAKNGRLRLEIVANDRGSGVDEIRLYHNGKIVADTAAIKTTRTAGKGHVIKVYDVPLEAGKNVFRALALGSDRTESEAIERAIEYAASDQRARLYVLVVGINSYRNAVLNLSFSVPDAQGMARFFRNNYGRLFKDVKVDEIYNNDATQTNIRSRLKELREARPDDVVVVYLAGHGETLNEDWMFIPYDLVTPERPEVLQRDGISSRELAEAVKMIPAQKLMVIIDACKSGAATISFRGLEERRALAQLSRSTGTHMIAATTKDQPASELDALGHGVFTYTLLEGLMGKAASGEKDVTARKLMVFVEQAMPELTRRYRSEEQYPVVSSNGMDFPLALH